jgi:hypothetical protein
MDELKKISNIKIKHEKHMVTELYNDFINEHVIINHKILKKDMVCNILRYDSFHIDSFGYVADEYNFYVSLTSPMATIYISFDKENNDRGQCSNLVVRAEDSTFKQNLCLYYKREYDDEIVEPDEEYEKYEDELDNEYIEVIVLDYERRIKILNKIKDDSDMTQFVLCFYPKLKAMIDEMIKLNDRKY